MTPTTPPSTPEPTPAPTSTTPETTPTTPTATTTPRPAAAAPTTGKVDQSLSATERTSGQYRLCGWVVATPASSEASTVARYDQPITVANRTSALTAEIPESARSGDYFSVKVTGSTPASGRRLLVMAEPDKDQQCAGLRKAASGKRPLQSVIGVPSGAFTKVVKLRYRTKTAGPYLLCIQVVEASDPQPRGAPEPHHDGHRIAEVREHAGRDHPAPPRPRRDPRPRDDAAQQRLSAARQKLAHSARSTPPQSARATSASPPPAKPSPKRGALPANAKPANASRACAAPKPPASAAPAPHSAKPSSIRVQERTYRQYRTGANLLSDTIGRMKKDTKKYCAKPSA